MPKLQLKNYIGEPVSLRIDVLPICPFCEMNRELTVVDSHGLPLGDDGDDDDEFFDYGGDLVEVVFRCIERSCTRSFVAEFYFPPSSIQDADPYEFIGSRPPQPITGASDLLKRTALPEDVVLDFEETAACMKNELYQAFGAMARRTIHSICADKKAAGSDLKQQIDFLFDKGVFTGDVADRAHELRTFGRHGAHPEWQRVTKEQVKDGLAHLIWIIRTIYQSPPPFDNKWRKSARRRYHVPKQ